MQNSKKNQLFTQLVCFENILHVDLAAITLLLCFSQCCPIQTQLVNIILLSCKVSLLSFLKYKLNIYHGEAFTRRLLYVTICIELGISLIFQCNKLFYNDYHEPKYSTSSKVVHYSKLTLQQQSCKAKLGLLTPQHSFALVQCLQQQNSSLNL